MRKIDFFDKKDVEITDIYFDEALALDAANLLKLDADRLLAGFRETAGVIGGLRGEELERFMKGKKRYGGQWEDSLIGGHTLGHYMSAVAQGVINPGLSDEEQARLRERLEEIVDALEECQKMTEGTEYEGYLFGAELNENYDNVDFQFDNVEKNLANIMTQAWVPWYTMHKILAGLVDAYELTANEKALQVANKLATWTAKRANAWDDDTHATVLGIEYGGMNDALYELYKVTDAPNKDEILKAAHQFDEVALFEHVKKGERNCLQGIHANTTIPKFLGALCRYEVLPEETEYLEYAKVFWDFVIQRQSYVTGGNSEDEHFRGDYAQNVNRDNVNNETCNTYNMLKLSRRLFVITGEKKYADYYENTLINAIMASQNHDNGLTMYFQPMASGYHKVFSSLDNSFWCCTGSGMENFTKLQDSIYFRETKSESVIVNLYLASVLRGDGFILEQQGDLSVSDVMSFEVTKEDDRPLSIRLRIPDWVSDSGVSIKFGDESYSYEQEGGYAIIPSKKICGKTIFAVQLPMEVRAYNLPDSEHTYAFKYGPYVLSAKLGTDKQALTGHGVGLNVPSRKAVPNDNIRIKSGAASVEEYIGNIGKCLIKEEGTMNFSLTNTDFDYIFTTHYNQYKESYGIYWTFSMDEDGISSEAVISQKNQERMERVQIDHVAQIARGQYEAGYVDEGDSVANTTELTRQANPGGTFSYTMKVDADTDNFLLVTRLLGERELPLVITAGENETVLEFNEKNITLTADEEEKYYQVLYRIPQNLIEKKEKITFTFAGSQTESSAKICQTLFVMRPFCAENDIKSVQNGKENEKNIFELTVPYHAQPIVKFELEDTRGYLTVNGNAIDEKEEKKLNSDDDVTVGVYAENFELVKEYTIRIQRDFTGFDEDFKNHLVKQFNFDGTLGEAVTVVKAERPVEAQVTCEFVEDVPGGGKGQSLSMDGTFGIRLMDGTKELGDSYTILFLMKPEVLGGPYDPTVMAGYLGEDAPRWMNLTFEGKLWSCNRGWVTAEPTGCFRAGEWQMAAVVVDGEKPGTTEGTVSGKLYWNGELMSDGNVAEKIMSQDNADLYFGVNPWDNYYKGLLGPITLLNRALTGVEVKKIQSDILK